VNIAVSIVSRPKNRPPRWTCRVSDQQKVFFDSQWVSLRFRSPDGAKWLTNLIVAAIDRGVLWPPPGHRARDDSVVVWEGDLDDDCTSSLANLRAHVEWCNGPRRGGVWYCMVCSFDPNQRYFHTLDMDIEPRSGIAARWLCELVMLATNAGVLAGYYHA
jgi:hypothetical protein